MREITPLARCEFVQLLDVQTTDQALRWALRNTRRSRKRELHVLLLLVEAVAELLTPERPLTLNEKDTISAEELLIGRLVVAHANEDWLTVDALSHHWAELADRERLMVLALLVGDLIGHRLIDSDSLH